MKPNIMCESAWVNVRSADWVILEENPNRIWGDTILKNLSECLGLSLCPWILWKKQRFTSRDFAKFCYTPWNFQGQKAKPMKIPHNFFMITPRNSSSFWNNSWNFHMLFLQYSWKIHILTDPPAPPCLDFFWNSPLVAITGSENYLSFLSNHKNLWKSLNGKKLIQNTHLQHRYNYRLLCFQYPCVGRPNIIRFIAGWFLLKTVTTNKSIFNVITNVLCHHIWQMFRIQKTLSISVCFSSIIVI